MLSTALIGSKACQWAGEVGRDKNSSRLLHRMLHVRSVPSCVGRKSRMMTQRTAHTRDARETRSRRTLGVPIDCKLRYNEHRSGRVQSHSKLSREQEY